MTARQRLAEPKAQAAMLRRMHEARTQSLADYLEKGSHS